MAYMQICLAFFFRFNILTDRVCTYISIYFSFESSLVAFPRITVAGTILRAHQTIDSPKPKKPAIKYLIDE